ncbi:acyl-CoA thioesterase [Desmospora activa]|uniref:Thioesterase-3 n=1 Tax=Desmospora activa DSM 45169 TaxID=1121389 RepID=A0A2T4ZAU3_9BACL|nr:thioesterase family protein [Desmospora activa]PTM59002.1 thioesterase-3 [Desmospora activa DSM 45169]
MSMKHTFSLVVRSTDVDMLGHVNNAKYLQYIEWARFDWMRKLGLELKEIQKRGSLPVVARIEIDYRRELTLDEAVKVVSEPLRMGKKSYVILQQIFNEEEELVAKAEVTIVTIDIHTRRATDMLEEIKLIFEEQAANS